MTASSTTPSTPSADAWLLGRWQLLRCEAPLEIQQGTRMHFRGDACVEYSIPAGGQTLQLELHWQFDGAILHTVHPDGTNPVSVRVTKGAADVLTFDFNGPRAWFVREQ
jgi:hypothetical protein